MSNRRLTSILLVTATLLATSWLVAPPVLAAESDPVMDKAVFNEPTGTPAQQFTIYQQIARLVDRVPAGEELRLAIYDFAPPEAADTADQPNIVNRMLNAYQRGVKVKIVLDRVSVGRPAHQRLAATLGSDDTKPSYIVACNDRFPNQIRGCIGTRIYSWPGGGTVNPYMHNKFMLFSKIVLNSGATLSNVVYQSSANMTVWDANEAYNNALTYSDARTYGSYLTYFQDLVRYRHSAAGNNNYYTDSGTGTTYRVQFFPRHEASGAAFTDPNTDDVYRSLDYIACAYTGEDGLRHQTDIRIMMWDFTRTTIAQRLVALRRANCWVDVVITNASAAVLSTLAQTDIQVTRCNYNVAPGIDIRVHHKYMLIDGGYGDDIIPRTFTGSPNLGWSSLRQADEAWVRIMGRGMHEDYLHNFWHIRDTCRARGGIIR